MARVLLIDDDAEIRETTAIRLQIGGHHVITAASPQEALDVADEHPHFDVAVLDLHLPKAAGDELLDLLRAHRTTADLPVVFYSANAPHATSVHGLSLADTRLTMGRPLNNLLSTISCLSH
ncbi:response regulator [Dactylosporangium roseum]|uniref:Response regulator n=1 Tax=Dactylosporangium roseum TaxID=47989 RepID=A0ABY5Z3J5_9ACTN|nr:response regulator [Dactylosporangium roseum]UWZ35653.1 response regulator [Dactylosporangium roseum]